MSTAPLPYQSVRLSTAGFKKLYESVRADPAAAKALADAIDADPRGTLQSAFKLTKPQLAAIGNTSDAELRRRAKVLLAALRSAKPKALRFRPRDADREKDTKQQMGVPQRMASCTCIIGP